MSSSRASFYNDPGTHVLSLLVATDKKYGKKLATTLVLGVLVALLVGVGVYLTIDRLTYYRSQAFATRDLVLSVNSITTTISNAESAQRGFTITGEPVYLQQFQAARAELPDDINRLATLLPDEDQDTLPFLKSDIDVEMNELQEIIDLRSTKGYDAARMEMMLDPDRDARNRTIARTGELSAREGVRFNFLVNVISELYKRLLLLMTVLLSFELILFAGVLVMITRDRSERLSNAQLLSAQNERLRDQRDNLNFANDHLEVAFKRFESLFQGVPVACCCTGPKGEILEWNRASELLFGFSIEEAKKSTIFDTVIRPSGFTNARNMTTGVMSGQSYENVEWICRTRDGNEIDVMSNAMPLFGEDGQAIGCMTATINMTERKAVERLKSEFVSTVSHELRTPLTSIRGALGLVCSGAVGKLPDQASRLCEIANNNTERLVRLINDILDIEKIEAGNLAFSLVDCSLTDLSRNAVDAIRNYADQFHVRVELIANQPDVLVTADPDRITQVLNNLLSNAIKFSPPTSNVVVEILNIDDDVRVSVQDSGSGIPEEFKTRIFGRFAQADSADTRQKGGTGLGLSISKAIVERLNGQIWFDPMETGTRFSFQLPKAAAGHVNVPIEGSSKALICEDDKDVVNILLALLSQKGIQAHVSYTAKQAKELLLEETYDVVILDILLPDMNGLDLLQQIRSEPKTQHLPAVIVSVTSPHGLHAISGDSIVDWIGKPLDSRRFLDTVVKAILLNDVSREVAHD